MNRKLTYKDLLSIIETYKDGLIEEFLRKHENDDLEHYAIDIRCYDNYLQQFEHFEAIEQYDFTTLEDLVKYAKELQFNRGGSWQVSFNNDDTDDYKWFEISETLFDWDF